MTRRLTIDDLTSITVPSVPALSPDGTRIAYVVRTPDAEKDRTTTALWLAEDGAEPRQLTQGDSDAAPAWSPDGAQIAFLRPVDGAAQVFLLERRRRRGARPDLARPRRGRSGVEPRRRSHRLHRAGGCRSGGEGGGAHRRGPRRLPGRRHGQPRHDAHAAARARCRGRHRAPAHPRRRDSSTPRRGRRTARRSRSRREPRAAAGLSCVRCGPSRRTTRRRTPGSSRSATATRGRCCGQRMPRV